MGSGPSLLQRDPRRRLCLLPVLQPLPLWLRPLHRTSFSQRTRKRPVRNLFLLALSSAYSLSSIRRRYAYDSIHNAISISRRPLRRGGYSRVSLVSHALLPLSHPCPQTCMLAEKSIGDVLNTNDNAEVLLGLHTAKRQRPRSTPDSTFANNATIST